MTNKQVRAWLAIAVIGGFSLTLIALAAKRIEAAMKAEANAMQIIVIDGQRCLVAPDGYAICEKEVAKPQPKNLSAI